MSTYWTRPSILKQYAEPEAEDTHIPWKITADQVVPLSTDGSLYHITRSPKHDILTKTYYLIATGFKFVNLPVTVTGVELKIISKRGGRVMDETVQLYIDNAAMGENRATTFIHPCKMYGGQQDLWKANINAAAVASDNFGVILRFQSHPNWPHKDPMLIDSIELRIH